MTSTKDAIEALKSVLCDPDGKCCISGSDADRQIVDDALIALTRLEVLEKEAEELAGALEQMLLCIGAGSINSFNITNSATNETWKWHDEWAKYATEALENHVKRKEGV